LSKETRLFEAGSVGLGISLTWWFREPLPVAFFDAAHGPEQTVIRAITYL
jgi:hypothetical protein